MKLHHSPGPWGRCLANNGKCPCGLIWDSTGNFVLASVTSSCREHESSNLMEGVTRGSDTFIANTRLITAAPEMLDELIAVLRRDMQGLEMTRPEAVRIMKIIERATGEAIEDLLKEST